MVRRHKPFIAGFLVAYALAIFMPPAKLLSMGKGKGGGS
jgi:hypothetical protein